MKKKLPAGDVVENVVDKSGIRTLRVAHSAEIEVERWKKVVPWYSRQVNELKVKTWQEKSLGMFYLEMKWPVREPFWTPGSANLQPPEGEKYNSLLWYLGQAKRVRDELPEAVEAFLGYVGELPERLLVRSAKGVPERVIAWTDGFVLCEVDVVEAGWLPERFVILR